MQKLRDAYCLIRLILRRLIDPRRRMAFSGARSNSCKVSTLPVCLLALTCLCGCGATVRMGNLRHPPIEQQEGQNESLIFFVLHGVDYSRRPPEITVETVEDGRTFEIRVSPPEVKYSGDVDTVECALLVKPGRVVISFGNVSLKGLEESPEKRVLTFRGVNVHTEEFTVPPKTAVFLGRYNVYYDYQQTESGFLIPVEESRLENVPPKSRDTNAFKEVARIFEKKVESSVEWRILTRDFKLSH